MITVHHLDASRSHRVLWLLEELELPYELVRYERDRKTLRAPRSLRLVHPLGKAPVVVDDGNTLAESGAIIEYLVGRYGNGRLAPTDARERQRYLYWLHYAEGSLMPWLLLKLVTTRLAKPPVPALVRPLTKLVARGLEQQVVHPELALHIGYISDQLGKTGWFAGDAFTAADIQMSFPVELAIQRGAGSAPTERLAAFLERIQRRPAYQRAEQRGGALRLSRRERV